MIRFNANIFHTGDRWLTSGIGVRPFMAGVGGRSLPVGGRWRLRI
jgi:hypothetical protein